MFHSLPNTNDRHPCRAKPAEPRANMASPSYAYANDEDVALRAPADFALLCPRDQKLSAGIDGFFNVSDRWNLRSNSVNFATSGVVAGQVVQLLGPSSQFKPPGEAFVAQAVNANVLTLRRKGQSAAAGQPAGPATGLIGVEFLIVTLAPQLEHASFEFDRRYGIANEGVSATFDPRDVRDVIVLSVLHGQYLAMSREGAGAAGDPFAAKASAMKAELDDLLARLVVRKGRGGDPSSRFTLRLSR